MSKPLVLRSAAAALARMPHPQSCRPPAPEKYTPKTARPSLGFGSPRFASTSLEFGRCQADSGPKSNHGSCARSPKACLGACAEVRPRTRPGRPTARGPRAEGSPARPPGPTTPGSPGGAVACRPAYMENMEASAFGRQRRMPVSLPWPAPHRRLTEHAALEAQTSGPACRSGRPFAGGAFQGAAATAAAGGPPPASHSCVCKVDIEPHFGHNRPKIWSMSNQSWPTSGQPRPQSPETGRNRAKLCRSRPSKGWVRPNIWAGFGQIRPGIDQVSATALAGGCTETGQAGRGGRLCLGQAVSAHCPRRRHPCPRNSANAELHVDD